jgi:hypothetical protein
MAGGEGLSGAHFALDGRGAVLWLAEPGHRRHNGRDWDAGQAGFLKMVAHNAPAGGIRTDQLYRLLAMERLALARST